VKLLQKISGKVERLAADGSGVILRAEGKPYLVYSTIPGETVNATVVKRTSDGLRARLDEVVLASPDRVTPRCPYAGTCGGCKWQHMSYVRQTAEKLTRLKSVFACSGVPCPIEQIIPCPEPFYYRNRMDFVFGRDGELGLKLPDRWWATLDLKTCFLLSPESVSIVNDVRDWARSTGLPFWNSKTHEGFFRYLIIREGKNTGERMVMLLTSRLNDSTTQRLNDFIHIIGQRATSIVHGINNRLTDLSLANEIIPLRGDPWIHELVNGVRYKITPNAFFQTNSIMAAKLQDGVIRHCQNATRRQPHPAILDLYCGSGFFSLGLAACHPDMRIIGIEENAEAIACANDNLKTIVARATIVDTRFIASKAEDFDWAGENPDVVIVDPPRAGLHPKVIETLLAHGPQTIVYVSCKYERFLQEYLGTASNAAPLSSAYRITEASALDLFSHTPHVELVVRLDRSA
jgi:23S rRNA (uracil1939-C5)-methyltransferase